MWRSQHLCMGHAPELLEINNLIVNIKLVVSPENMRTRWITLSVYSHHLQMLYHNPLVGHRRTGLEQCF